MKPKKQQAAIAEVCGWKKWQAGDPFLVGQRFSDANFNRFARTVERIYPDGVTLDVDESPLYKTERFGEGREFEPINGWLSPEGKWQLSPPNYPGDLNAMNSAEKTLGKRSATYANELEEVCRRDRGDLVSNGWKWHATAAQRAEAFLRILGKWQD